MTDTIAPALTFEVVPDWEKRPDGLVHLDVAGVSVDSNDRVYIFTRFDNHVMVYCTSNGDHVIRKFTLDGKLLAVMGNEGVPSDTGYDGSNLDTVVRAAGPFN